jgi:RNA polymerase sigma-70 factor (ECF subfamily)
MNFSLSVIFFISFVYVFGLISRYTGLAEKNFIPPGIKSFHAQSWNKWKRRVSAADPQAQFEDIVMPHLDAAYNLARWLAGNDHDAEDIAQEACVRALRFVGGYRGGNSRSWLLAIVRNTAYSWLKKNRPKAIVSIEDEDLAEIEDPAAPAFDRADAAVLRAALEELPLEFREALVLRHLEGLSYKEIAEVADVPVGTVMSRLARARQQLQNYLAKKGES